MNEQTQSGLQEGVSLHLWQLITLNEGTTFKTTGRGSRPGVEFTYEVSRKSAPTTPATDYDCSTITPVTDSTESTDSVEKCGQEKCGAGKRGRKSTGQSIPGYGNELWIISSDGQRKKKSISRSTVDLAYRNAVEEQEREGFVSGPRKLGVPGVRSNLYAMFVKFGVIRGALNNGEAADVSESVAAAANANAG